jgi:Ca2+/Na+ antiporter
MNAEISNFVNSNSSMIKSIFLLILAVSGNFVGETLSCKTQYHMSNNMVIKHMVILMLIYFTLNFTSSATPHPLEVAKKTAMIWVVFVMFTKMPVSYTLAGFLVLITFFVLTNLVEYEENKEQENTESKQSNNVPVYEKGQQILFFIFLGILVAGFTTYMLEKRAEYGDKFEMNKFLLGVHQCDSLR